MCSGGISIDKEIKRFGLLVVLCVCVLFFGFSSLEELHSWAQVLPV